MSEMTTYHWSFEQDVLAYKAAGLAGMGVWRTKLEEFGEERGADLLCEQGLEVSNLSFVSGFTGAEGHSIREAVDDAREAVRIAGLLRAENLIVVAGGRGGHIGNHAQRLLCDALQLLGDEAAEVGVHLAVQPLNRALAGRWSILNSTQMALDLLHTCRHAHVGLALDLFHMGREPGLIERLPSLVPWLRTVLVSDAPADPRNDHDRTLPGEGNLPLAKLFTELAAAGYNGWYELQILSDRLWQLDHEVLLGRCLQSWQGSFPKPPHPAATCPSRQSTA